MSPQPMEIHAPNPLPPTGSVLKRTLDITASVMGLVVLSPFLLIGWCSARLSTGASGFLFQERVGQHGKIFYLVKLRSMDPAIAGETSVTVAEDPRITAVGRWLRRLKLDEIPQLWNVLRGDMSLVGPRPDVPGFADRLDGPDRIVLSVKPGITGPATLAFRDEEELLSGVPDPEVFNAKVLYPAKVELNKSYVANWSFVGDLRLILETVFFPFSGWRIREGRDLIKIMEERSGFASQDPSTES